jgi:hypothetical protein
MKQGDIIKLIEEIADGLAKKIKHDKAMFEIKTNTKYKFSRNWYQAYFDLKDYDAVDEWCEQQFGKHPKNPDAWSRWWHKFEDSILFRDEKDYVLFTLRWS